MMPPINDNDPNEPHPDDVAHAARYRYLKVKGYRTRLLHCLEHEELVELVGNLGLTAVAQNDQLSFSRHATRLRRQILAKWQKSPLTVYRSILDILERTLD